MLPTYPSASTGVRQKHARKEGVWEKLYCYSKFKLWGLYGNDILIIKLRQSFVAVYLKLFCTVTRVDEVSF